MVTPQRTIQNQSRFQRVWNNSSGWRYWLLGLLGLAIGMRVWNLKKQPFWIDEFTELLISSQDFGSLSTFPDGFPPLGLLVSRGWLEWGSFESARYLAVAYGVATVIMVGLAALRLGGRRAGLFGLAIAGLSPFLIWYSQELRPYSLVMMLAAASLLSLLRATETGRRFDWILYGVVSGLGIWTHYFFALTIAAGMLWLWSRRKDLPGRRYAIAAHVVMTVMALPLLALLPGDLGLQVEFQAEVASEDPSSFGVGPLGFAFFSFFSGFAIGPSLRELHSASLVDALQDGWLWLALFGVLSAALAWWVIVRWRDKWVQLLATLVLGPVLLAGVLSVIADVGFRPRYVAWCIVPLIVLVAVALSRVSPRVAGVVLAALVIAFGISYVNRHWNERYGNEDLRAAMEGIELSDPGGDVPVMVSANYMAPLAGYYGPNRTVHRVPEVSSKGDGLGEALAAVAEASGGGAYFLVYTREFHGDSGGLLLDAILAGSQVDHAATFAGARLYAVVPNPAGG